MKTPARVAHRDAPPRPSRVPCCACSPRTSCPERAQMDGILAFSPPPRFIHSPHRCSTDAHRPSRSQGSVQLAVAGPQLAETQERPPLHQLRDAPRAASLGPLAQALRTRRRAVAQAGVGGRSEILAARGRASHLRRLRAHGAVALVGQRRDGGTGGEHGQPPVLGRQAPAEGGARREKGEREKERPTDEIKSNRIVTR